jgi:hypothetical protein
MTRVVRSPFFRFVRALDNDTCPKCGNELAPGYECNTCDFDAEPLRRYIPLWREDHAEEIEKHPEVARLLDKWELSRDGRQDEQRAKAGTKRRAGTRRKGPPGRE